MPNTNSTYVIDANHTYMILKNALWLKVFYHNTTFGDYFNSANADEVLNSHTNQKFSILGTIDSSFLIDKKYEFLYEVPGKRGYNRWRQTNHPKDTNLSTTPEQNGFKPIKLSWTKDFGSLKKCAYTYYCCATGENSWWFTIGAKQRTSDAAINTMPLINEGGYSGYEVALWIRIPPTKGIDGLRISCRVQTRSYNVPSIIIALLLSQQ